MSHGGLAAQRLPQQHGTIGIHCAILACQEHWIASDSVMQYNRVKYSIIEKNIIQYGVI